MTVLEPGQHDPYCTRGRYEQAIKESREAIDAFVDTLPPRRGEIHCECALIARVVERERGKALADRDRAHSVWQERLVDLRRGMSDTDFLNLIDHIGMYQSGVQLFIDPTAFAAARPAEGTAE